jgi:hypothetical protein
VTGVIPVLVTGIQRPAIAERADGENAVPQEVRDALDPGHKARDDS